MARTTFTTAVLIFINLWLIALTSFGTAASAILLYILGAVDNIIGSSVAAALSFTYLIFQSINATSVRPKSWVARTTIQLPRVLIVGWIVTTTVGLVVALRQPLCQSGDVKTGAAAWQAGLGCWVFRALVSLNVVMLVLSFSIFVLLEINGRNVPLGLFHFEFTSPHNQTRHHRRRTLVGSAYGSTDSLTSPITITSEDEQNLNLTGEKRPRTRGSTVSPSPTYRTFDLGGRRTRTGAGTDRSLSAVDEESILDLSSSRQSSCTTTTLATLPLTQFPSAPTTVHTRPGGHDLISSSQLTSRPLSNVPVLPTSFQLQLKELERLKAEHTARATTSSSSVSVPTSPTKANRPALYSNTSKSNLKSSCALPLSSTTPSGSVDLGTMLRESQRPRSADLEIEAPPPAWCPQALREKPLPLSADPAIKRLTELRNNRLSNRVSRRLSFSGFEFGFGGGRKNVNVHCGSTVRTVGEDTTNRTEAGTVEGKVDEKPRSSSVAGVGEGKENMPLPVPTAAEEDNKDIEVDKENQKQHKIMNRTKPLPGNRKRSTTVAGKGPSMTVFPPITAPPVPAAGTVKRVSGAGHGRKESLAGTGGSRKRGKSMVERGRYERLPR
ncbi:hypothetical protein OHC33_005528 [Knufia fluminis]|uniref:Uncharacterized protein n=1 Tax=Knufia fluminis TaxID=191047 RepID=A0AAN8I5V5_9EURO|nr:hypothetical protein OHC33_005528 [Knufia fluminis]